MRNPKLSEVLRSDYVLEYLIKDFSGGLSIDTTNVCNANCVCCPYQFNEDAKKVMSTDQFKRAIDSTIEMGDLGSLLLTPVAGDPLVNRFLFEGIAYARSKGVRFIAFATNGILLGRNDNYKKIIDLNVDHVHISSAGFEPELYQKIFRVDKVNELVDGLVKLAEYKKSKNGVTKVVVSFMINRGADALLEVEGWRRLRPYFEDGTLLLAGHESFSALLGYADETYGGGTKVLPETRSSENLVDNWSDTITDDMLPTDFGVKKVTHSPEDPPCWRVFQDLAVLPDGKVRVCSCRYMKTTDDELVIGDLNDAPMKEIYYGDRHKALIKKLAGGDWPEVCKRCTLYAPYSISEERLDELHADAEQNKAEIVEAAAIGEINPLPAARVAYRTAARLARGGKLDEARSELNKAESYSQRSAAAEARQMLRAVDLLRRRLNRRVAWTVFAGHIRDGARRFLRR